MTSWIYSELRAPTERQIEEQLAKLTGIILHFSFPVLIITSHWKLESAKKIMSLQGECNKSTVCHLYKLYEVFNFCEGCKCALCSQKEEFITTLRCKIFLGDGIQIMSTCLLCYTGEAHWGTQQLLLTLPSLFQYFLGICSSSFLPSSPSKSSFLPQEGDQAQ